MAKEYSVYEFCLKGQGGEEIFLPENIMEGAGRCIHRMVELGG